MAADPRNPLTGMETRTDAATRELPSPEQRLLADTATPYDVPPPAVHGCWYPSADPGGRYVAFICDRAGVPQLWTGPVDGEEVRRLDADPDPVTEVSWSPDGRWIAYTVAPDGGELTRVLCVRPDGTGRHLLAGGEPGTSARLGCWQHDGSALAVTVTDSAPAGLPFAAHPGAAGVSPPLRAHRDGRGVLLDPGAPRHEPAWADDDRGVSQEEPEPRALSAYLVDPEGAAAPVLLASERGAANQRVCDLSRDGRLALVYRGPRGRREALVLRTGDRTVACALPVADGDPWIGGFSPDAGTVWLRSDGGREHAALVAAHLDPRGHLLGTTVAAQRPDCGLELLALGRDGRRAVLAWNVRGVSELETAGLTPARHAEGPAGLASFRPASAGVARTVDLPHEVVTRIAPTADPDAPLVALSGSRRHPGVWWLPHGQPLRTPWSSRDEDALPPGRTPVRPTPMSPVARDGLTLGGWYYRAPGRSPGEPAPCVLHLHGGPEEQERPVLEPLYLELLGRGLDVFAPDVRGSSGYGRTFVDADLGAGRFDAINDVADCAAHVMVRGLADPRRMAVMGRSYGGYLVMASLVWHPDLFRTGVAVCGMSDFATFFAGTEPWIAQSAAHKYGHPEHDRELLRALSPMSRVDALRAPVLAVHGEHDTNVPPGESEQFVRAARERGLEAELLLLRHEGHDFRRADNRRLFRRTAADWMERHLAG
ncbi:S9 family peptidase [Streptomyces sp. WAC 01420]|uniref:prolyl oligopeptidase family serine peptidase n=2 Tax=unclassified Streptomyces TaxID=2593676 RepID=UPI000F719AE1|nr:MULTISPECIES: prolyl oligopeptidase family serine peptidase [unclassified Streptomyces]AZM58364.1 S9 family peptidase [Streptomyces sp. WAC 01438]RSM88873.1 S9 family peptidase [Streptomyces sp. WAC 01420]